MRNSSRFVLGASAVAFVTIVGGAYSQTGMKTANDPLKPGREPAEDGSIAITSGNRLHRPGIQIDDNIAQPGKHLNRPGRNIEEGTYDWDKAVGEPRRTLNEEPGKKKRNARRGSDLEL
jgi:hypothetical protein